MQSALPGGQERKRLQYLRSLNLLDSEPEEQFDRIIRFARDLLEVPSVLVSLVDEDRQWFKSSCGLDGDETPREYSFCRHTISGDSPVCIPDAREDPRVAHSPLVQGEPFIRSYLGVPLKVGGFTIGTLCCLDFQVREFSQQQIKILQALARWTEREIELRDKNLLLTQVKRNHSRTQALFQEAPYPLMQVSQGGDVEEINRVAEEFWSKFWGSVPNILKDPRLAGAGIEEAFRRAGEEGEVQLEPFSLRSNSRQLFYLRVRVKPILNELGDEAFLVAFEDVTEFVLASERQEQLSRRAKKRESEAEKVRQRTDEFVARLSHEMRNPLNGIVGLVNLLQNGEVLNGEHVDTLSRCARALTTLVDDTLDLARISQGRLSIESTPFNLPALVKNVCRLAESEWDEKNLELKLQYDLQGDVVAGDPNRLRQILSNLISNAFKYTDSGEVRVSVVSSEDVVRFQIEDTGRGIPEEKLPNIFDPYFQVKDRAGDSQSGVGLGLSIVHQLTKALKGRIAVQSGLGEGTLFTLDLPLPPAQLENPEEGTRPPLGLTLLVVDDNPINRRIMTMQLDNLGCRVNAVEHGQAALDYLQDHTVDLVLMDCHMPVLDGYEATRRLRAQPEKYGSPVIVALSGAARLDAKQRCLDAGMDGYLKKPVRLDQLYNQLRAFKS